MVKKESLKRGYMTKDEIIEKAKEKRPGAPYSYLHVLIRDKSYHLSPRTRENAYRALQDLAKEKISEIDERIKIETSEAYKRQLIERDKPQLLGEIASLDRLLGVPDRGNWQGKNPQVFRERNIESLKVLIKEWHRLKPDYIFLSETSSIPYGYAIKKAWKEAYPEEDLPKFYRIESWTESAHIIKTYGVDDSKENTALREKIKEGVAIFLKKRIKKEDAKIILFDEYDKMLSPQRIDLPRETGGTTLSGPAKEIMEMFPKSKLYYAGLNNNGPHLDFGRFSFPKFKYPRVTLKRNIDYKEKRRISASRGKPGRSMALAEPLENVPREQVVQEILEYGYSPTGRTIKDPKRRRMALRYIQELNEIGEECGREFYEELERKQNLEKKVTSVIAIFGIGASIFFLGSSVTGYAIGSLSTKTSSFLGVGFLIIGLIASFFWINSKKK
jgi:hypothetical protein